MCDYKRAPYPYFENPFESLRTQYQQGFLRKAGSTFNLPGSRIYSGCGCLYGIDDGKACTDSDIRAGTCYRGRCYENQYRRKLPSYYKGQLQTS